MRRRISILALIFALLLSSSALAIVGPSESFYVADYAGVLSASLEQDILDANDELYSQTGGQIVVVAVEYLNGYYSDEYANRLFNDWGVGDAEKNNGMLLLLATQESKFWLVQGRGIRDDFDSDMVDRYLSRYFERSFDAENYDGAVRSLFGALLAWYANFYHVEIPSWNIGGQTERTTFFGGTVLGRILSFLLGLLILFGFIMLFRSIRRRVRRRRSAAGGYVPPVTPFIPIIHVHRRPRRPPPPPPVWGPGWNPGPPPGGPTQHHSSGSSFRSGGGGHSGGFGGGRGGSSFRSGGGSFRSGGGGRSSGGGGGRR